MTPPSPAPAAPGPADLPHAPLHASGLPPRILAPLLARGLSTLADLRPPTPPPDKLDPDDRSLLARISAYAAAACDGRPPPLSLPEWLALFLPPRLADALHLHYALLEPAVSLALHEAKLRDTGFKLGVTRERARQLLLLATSSLRQTLPLAAAEPLFRATESALHSAGGALSPPDLARLASPAWGGTSPVGAFLLLSHLLPSRLTLYRGFFTSLPPTLIERIETSLRDTLSAAPSLLPLAEIDAALPPPARPPLLPSAIPLLRVLLRHLPDTLATRDDRAGFAARHGALLLREILASSGDSPLRTLVDAFNDRLHPECRRGAGYIRDTLSRDPLVRKTAPGRYALPGGLQTQFPLAP